MTARSLVILAMLPAWVWAQGLAITSPLNWQAITPPAGYARCFLTHPEDETLWFVCSEAGFYVSNNSGVTYRHVGTRICDDVVVDPLDSNRIMAVCSLEGIYVSENRGGTWALRRPATTEYLSTLHISPRDGTILVGPRNTVAQHGIFRSVDHGLSFQYFPYGTAQRDLIPWAIGEDPETGTFYVGTEIGYHPQPYKPPLFRSRDRGQSWEEVSGVITWHVTSFEYDPVSKRILALTEGAGLYRSADQGATWALLSHGPSTNILHSPRAGSTHLWATRQGTVVSTTFQRRDSILFSPDMGATWFSGGGLPDRNPSIRFNKTGTTLYASTFPAGLFVASLPSQPQANFQVLMGADGNTVTFTCDQIKMYDRVKLMVEGQEWPLTQTVGVLPFPFSGVSCSFRIPPGTRARDYAARLEMDGFAVPFTLTVNRSAAAIVTAMTTVLFTTPANYAPGDIMSIFGVRLSRASSGVGPANLATAPFPTTLNQSRVTLFSAANSMFSAAMQLVFTDQATDASQINVQLPTNLSDGVYRLRVDRLSATGQLESSSAMMSFTVGAYQPLFLGNTAYPVFLQNITQDPLGRVFATAAQPARPGDILTLYATGMGVTNPRLGAGTVPTSLTPIVAQPRNSLLTAGGRVTPVEPIGGIVASPQFPGLFQMSIQLPANLDTSQGVVLRHELDSVRVDIPVPAVR